MGASKGNVSTLPTCSRTTFEDRGRYGTRLQWNNYIADIVSDRDREPLIHHCIVQRIGRPQVLYLDQENTFAAALEYGHRRLVELLRAEKEKHNVIYEFAEIRVSQ